MGPSAYSNPIKSGENEWEQCFLYLKSKKPIKVTESYWEQFFQQGNEEFFAQKKIFPVKKIFQKKFFFSKVKIPKILGS